MGLNHENRNNLTGTQEEVHKKAGTTFIKKYDTLTSGFCSLCGAWKGQLGLEPDFKLYIKHLSDIFDEVKRALKPTGTCWINLGDTYSGGKEGNTDEKNTQANTATFSKPSQAVPSKSLLQIPSRFAIEMSDMGWILRNKIIWHKKNCMPSSAKDRFTNDYEEIFFFVKSKKYYFEQQVEEAISQGDKRINQRAEYNSKGKTDGGFSLFKGKASKEWMQKYQKNEDSIHGENAYSVGGRNKRAVWRIATKPHPFAHFAVYPEELIETPIKAGCPEGGIVLDPFIGSGTTAIVAQRLNRRWMGFEINAEYIKIATNRLSSKLASYVER